MNDNSKEDIPRYSKLSCLAHGGSKKITKTSRKSPSLSEIRPGDLPDIIQRRYHVDQLKHFLTNITQRHRKVISIKRRSSRRRVHYHILYIIHFSSPFLSALGQPDADITYTLSYGCSYFTDVADGDCCGDGLLHQTKGPRV